MRSTVGQIRELENSNFWRDVCDELDVWILQIRLELENLDLELSHRALDQLSGCAKALRNVKNIPEVLIGLLEDQLGPRETVLKNLT